MPLHVAAVSRRRFLQQGTATVAGLTFLRSGWGAEQSGDPNFFALLSDTHVPDSPNVTARGTNMTTNLTQVVREVTGQKTRPAGVIINGDCAYLKGLPADYANLSRLVAPLAEAGLPLHVTMGNHDDRAALYAALEAQRTDRSPVESKHVTIIESPHANWFLLDSLTQVNVVTGEIGAEQRAWLAAALAARPDKPALVMAHHTPQFEPPSAGKVWTGMKDTQEFMELLADHRHVKAFIFGHSHTWEVKRHAGLHLVNLPPVAYVFAEEQPNGWVAANVRENGLELQLHTIDPAHRQNGRRVELNWS